VELWLKALESWMENAKGGQFIRNGFERPAIERVTGDSVLNKSVPFSSDERRLG
jgi:hypothetical protein